MGIDDERYHDQARDFAANSSKASIFKFVVSSYAIISDILDDPESYGLFDCIEDEVDEASNSEKRVEMTTPTTRTTAKR